MGNAGSRAALWRESVRLPSCFVAQRRIVEETHEVNSTPGRRIRRFAAPLALVVMAWWGGCATGCQKPAPAQSPQPISRRPPEKVDVGSSGQVATGTWHLHPMNKGRATASFRLSSGALLEVDEAGGRWVSKQGATPVASPFSAPEPLVAVLDQATAFAAVGRSGAVYHFDTPLGPYVRTVTPPEPYVTTAVVERTLVSINRGGQLFRSIDLGKRFARVEVEGFFTDLGADISGRIFAVSVPEQWYASTDLAEHFSPVELPSIAPLSMTNRADGQLVVGGLFEQVTPADGKWEAITHLDQPKGGVNLPSFARVKMVAKGTALLDDDGYLELSRPESSTHFIRKFGAIDRGLERGTMQSPKRCSDFRLFGSTKRPILLCLGGDSAEVSPPLRLYEWQPEGRKWLALPPLRGSATDLTISVSPLGQIALQGVCAPHLADQGCSPYGGVLLSRNEAPRFFQVPSGTHVIDAQYDEDEQYWVLLKRDKDNHLVLMGPMLGDQYRIVDLTHADPQLTVDQKNHAQLLTRDDGLLSVIAERFATFVIGQFDERGELLSVGRAPAGVFAIHGTGRRLGAVDVSSNIYWESTSGGLTWRRQSLPTKVCRESRCSVELRCTAQGCLVGDELVRSGYGGSSNDAVDAPRYVDPTQEKERIMTGLSCTLSEATFQPLSDLWSIPSAHDVLLGQSLWYAAAADPSTASVDFISASSSDDQLRRTVLFPQQAASTQYVLKYSPQIEGGAAVRYPVRTGTQELAGPVEIAWDNRIEGVTERVSVGLGTPGPGAALRVNEHLQLSMLSVAERGIFFQASQDRLHDVFYFPGGTAPPEPVSEPVFPPLRTSDEEGTSLELLERGRRSEGVVAHGKRNALLLLADNRVVVRRMEGREGASYVPYLMAGLSSSAGELNHTVQIAYRGRAVGFLSVQLGDDGDPRAGSFVELGQDQAFLPPIPVALPRHLPDRPKVCSPSRRNETPRVVVSEDTERTRRVSVSGVEQDPVVLSVTDVVLFGSPDDPCLGAWTAESSRRSDNDRETTRYVAVITPSGPYSSWLFRLQGLGRADAEVAVQPMKCSFE